MKSKHKLIHLGMNVMLMRCLSSVVPSKYQVGPCYGIEIENKISANQYRILPDEIKPTCPLCAQPELQCYEMDLKSHLCNGIIVSYRH